MNTKNLTLIIIVAAIVIIGGAAAAAITGLYSRTKWLKNRGTMFRVIISVGLTWSPTW